MYLLQTTAIVNGLLIFAGILLAVFLLLFVIFVPIGLWISALFSGVFIGPGKMIGMRLRRVAPQIIVNELIKAKKAGLQGIDIDQLEAHHLAQGNVTNVIDALISAKNAGIELNFEEAAGIDLAGRDVLQAVKDSVNPKVIDSPMI
ncbi:MAG: flotillin-like FloA family protein, partial [Bacteroidota bacterium]